MNHDIQSRWNKAWGSAVPVEPNASANNNLGEVVLQLRNLIKDLDGDVRTLKAQVETLKSASNLGCSPNRGQKGSIAMRTQLEIARELTWKRATAEISAGRRTRAKSWGGKPNARAERKSKAWQRES